MSDCEAQQAPPLSTRQRFMRWLYDAPYNERTLRGRIYYAFYGQVWGRFRLFMHARGFCYAPLKWDDEGWHRWCQQCGLRESYKRDVYEYDFKRKVLRFREDYMARVMEKPR